MISIIKIYLLLWQFCRVDGNDHFIFSYVSYNDSLINANIYRDEDQYFDAIAIDNERNQIFVGAKNSILRFSLIDLHLLEKFQWNVSTDDFDKCLEKMKSPNECQNYIRVLAIRSNDQSILTCGTNGYNPICAWRRLDSLTTEKIISADGKSPYHRNSPSVYEILDDGEFYNGNTNEPLTGPKDSLIQKSFTQGKQLRTQQHDSNWFKNPEFVRILNIGSYIYTFFREIALEHLSCGTNIYSRVARLCKYDDGTMKFSDTFRSFSKVRLSCSLQSSNELNSFDFNELQSIYFHHSSKLIFGGFNLPKSGLNGSAICIYSVHQLETIFESSFLIQKSNESFWLPLSPSKSQSEKCEPNLSIKNNSFHSGPVLRSGILHSISKPILLKDIRIGHLLVDEFKNLNIYFIITLDGLWLKKYSSFINENNENQFCLLEQIQLKSSFDQSNDEWKINQVVLRSSERELLMTTSNSILKISVARCHQYLSKDDCYSSMDPYCSWDDRQKKCFLIRNQFSIESRLSSLTCPNRKLSKNLHWSTWFECKQETGEKCQCRTRSCPDHHLNSTCQIQQIEIKECQIHGGWSTWSEWSSCPQTCDKSIRYRRRTCSNPTPKYFGRLCVGSDYQEELCSTMMNCSISSSSLIHSSWTDWTDCSKSCGGGIQQRKRIDFNSNENVSLCLNETRLCNEFSCPIESKIVWTNWTKLSLESLSENEFIEQRFRFVVSSSLFDEKNSISQIQFDKIQYRICQEKFDQCEQFDSFDQWSTWSDWTDCPMSFGSMNSWQIRHRQCLGQRCFGRNYEKRSCPSCSSIQSNWSCWSDWSTCSSCSFSISLFSSKQIRTRQCLTDLCQGLSYEERSCSCLSSINSLFVASLSFLFGCLFIFITYQIRFCLKNENPTGNEIKPKEYLTKIEENYFQSSTSNSSSSPKTGVDSEILTNSNHFQTFDSSSISTSGFQTIPNYFKEIPSKTLNIYVNPREVPLVIGPIDSSKRSSILSSIKINLDADDL